MEKKKVIVIGCGGRGMGYSKIMKDSHSDYFEIVGIAEPVKSRREYVKNLFNTPDDMCFESWEPLLEKTKFADVCIVATQDRDHYLPAMKA
ncbi:MAG: Gfo/Idh/MocA family oxidoreductase, partial [Oscillospiraceae bacterium]|nr:Gfo/Idh/MocA family oxidoreductase [Oscillospiraceae bacterium]